MKLPGIHLLLVALSALTACGVSTPSIDAPRVAEIPQEFEQSCSRPVVLPERDLSQLEVELYWATDRTNLVNCGDLHRNTVEWITSRDGALRNE